MTISVKRPRLLAATCILSFALVGAGLTSCTTTPSAGPPAPAATDDADTPTPVAAPTDGEPVSIAPALVPPSPEQRLLVEASVAVGTSSLLGTVRDVVLAGPLVGACVYLYSTAGAYAGHGSCVSGTGAFSLADVPAGTYKLAAFDPAGTHPTTWFGNTTSIGAAASIVVAEGDTTSNVDIDVTQLTGLTGKATDAVTGGPVVGACAYATQTSGGTAKYASCAPNTSGVFTITGMAPGAYSLVVADPAALHVTSSRTATVVAGRTATGADVALAEVTGVTGTIVDAVSGALVGNGCAMLFTFAGAYVPNSWRCSRLDGRFVIDGVSPGSYRLAYYDPAGRFLTQWFDGQTTESMGAPVTIATGATTAVGTARVQTFGTVSGLVKRIDGQPAAGACVYLNRLDGTFSGNGACAGNDGHFVVTGILPGGYHVAAYPAGVTDQPSWYNDQETEATATVVRVVGLTDTPLDDQVVGGPPDTTPPGPVTDLTATSSDSAVRLSWANPTTKDYSGATIRRASGAVAPSTPTSGTAVADVTAPSASYVDAGLVPGQTYSYAVFAHDEVANAAAPAKTTIVVVAKPAAQHVCGSITSNTTWSPSAASVYVLDCPVVIAPSATLTVAAGTIVKGSSGAGLQVNGGLVANGTVAAPVTFTSWRDDTVGGDTNDDGTSTGPASGDWPGLRSSQDGPTKPTITIGGSRVSWASSGIDLQNSTVSVTNSVVRNGSGGIAVSSPVGIPIVTGNIVNNVGGTAVSIADASVDLARLGGNNGTGNGMNAVALTAVTVTVNSGLPWAGNLVPLLWSGCSALTVAPNVTLTLGAGTIVKGGSGGGCGYFNVSGSLVATGTGPNPVVLTSWRDDTVGGDTNGDGNATAPSPNDWSGITSSPAGNGNPEPVLALDHVDVRWGSVGVSATGASVSVRNSTVTRVVGVGIDVSSPVGIPTITGNTVTNAGGPAIRVTYANLDLAKLDGNNGSGNGENSVQLSGDTLAVSSTLPWTGTLVPVLWSGCNALTVPANITLTLAAGAIVKSGTGGCSYFNIQGTLLTTGTAAKPVVLTSWRDDTAGGDTNGDGNATGPATSDWYGISASPAGNGLPNPVINLDHVDIRWASGGVAASATTVTVKNSTVTRVAGVGIDVSSPVGIPTITGNTVTNAGGPAIRVTYANLDLAKLDGNNGSGNGENSVQLSGDTLAVSGTLPWSGNLVPVLWSGCTGLTVPANITLTLAAGAIVKNGTGGCSYFNIQGTLRATGTAAKPVVLTSWRDDTAGGDTNGDGNATGPTANDWYGISASPAGNGLPNPVINLDHVDIRWATTALYVSGSAVSVTNSSASHVTGNAFDVSSTDGVPTFTGNTFSAVDQAAISIWGSGVDLARLSGNNASTTRLRSIVFGGDTLTVSSSLPWSGNLVPLLYSGCSGLSVPASITLTLNAGAIVKAGGGGCNYLTVQGSLVVNATGVNPAIVTSWRDDTAGGDTNGDGSATGPMNTDWSGITANPAGNGLPDPVVNLDHVDVRWASAGLSASSAAVSVRNSSFTHLAGNGIDVSSIGGPTIAGNTVSNVLGAPIRVNSSTTDLGALNGNSGSGNGINGLVLSNVTVVANSSLTWSGTLRPVVEGSLLVPPNVTVSAAAGTVVKAAQGAQVTVQGSLVANGTAGAPVIFTSIKDDSAGGDTNADGNSTAPAAGDWYGIYASSAGNGVPDPTVTLTETEVRYASVALNVSSPGTYEFHGAIRETPVGIEAGDNYVDATGTDWGDPSGPGPDGSGASANGLGILYMPYEGYVPPPPPPPAPPQPVPADEVCDDYYFIGVRGSGEAPQGPWPDYGFGDSPSDGMGSRTYDMYYGFQNRLHELDASKTVRPIGIKYKALGVVHNVFNWGTDAYFNSINEGIDVLYQQILDEIDRCGSQGEKFILSGYSQGALVVHSTLRSLAEFEPQALSRIAAVVLLADPAKVNHGSETVWEAGYVPARESIQAAEGIWTKAFGNWFGSSEWYDTTTRGAGPLPSAITGRTLSMCRDNDIVCAPGRGSSASVHTGYVSSELNDMGTWAADLVA